MYDDSDTRQVPVILTLGDSDAEHDLVKDLWFNFDVCQCQCFDQRDKTRILNVIEAFPGEAAASNVFIRNTAAAIFHRQDDELSEIVSEPSSNSSGVAYVDMHGLQSASSSYASNRPSISTSSSRSSSSFWQLGATTSKISVRQFAPKDWAAVISACGGVGTEPSAEHVPANLAISLPGYVPGD
jgi:hypothetical protein